MANASFGSGEVSATHDALNEQSDTSNSLLAHCDDGGKSALVGSMGDLIDVVAHARQFANKVYLLIIDVGAHRGRQRSIVDVMHNALACLLRLELHNAHLTTSEIHLVAVVVKLALFLFWSTFARLSEDIIRGILLWHIKIIECNELRE